MQIKFWYLADFQSVIQLAAALNIALGVAPQLRNISIRLYGLERDETENRVKSMISTLLDGNEYYRSNNLPFSETRNVMHQKLRYRYQIIQDLISKNQEELSSLERQAILSDARSSRKSIYFGVTSIIMLFAASASIGQLTINEPVDNYISMDRVFFYSQMLVCALLYLPVLQSILLGFLAERQINKRRVVLRAEIRATTRDILDA